MKPLIYSQNIITLIRQYWRSWYRSSSIVRISIIIISHPAVMMWSIHKNFLKANRKKTKHVLSRLFSFSCGGTTCGRRRSVYSAKTFLFSFLYTLLLSLLLLLLLISRYTPCLNKKKKFKLVETHKLHDRKKKNVLEEITTIQQKQKIFTTIISFFTLQISRFFFWSWWWWWWWKKMVK